QGYHSAVTPSRNATWGEEPTIDAEMQAIYDKFVSKGIPVLLGEFGAYPTPNLTGTDKTLNYNDTTYWDKYVQEAARSRGIAPFYWSTPGSIFNWSTGAVTDQAVLNAVSPIGTCLPPPGGDGAQHCFELSAQSWTASGAPIGSVTRSTTTAYAGAGSLAVNFTGTMAGTAVAYVNAPAIPAGKTVTFRLWVPAGHKLGWVQAYAADRKWAWTSHWYSGSSLVSNGWNTLSVSLPSTVPTPLQQVGVQFSTSNAWTGTCYLDSVAW
ncbi:MAG: cellulase family glycosylhydrolase, partial [Armatimonadota bacterium]